MKRKEGVARRVCEDLGRGFLKYLHRFWWQIAYTSRLAMGLKSLELPTHRFDHVFLPTRTVPIFSCEVRLANLM